MIGPSPGECTQPHANECVRVDFVKDFDIAMAGTGIGIGSQVHTMATIEYESGEKEVITSKSTINKLYRGASLYQCLACYGDGDAFYMKIE